MIKSDQYGNNMDIFMHFSIDRMVEMAYNKQYIRKKVGIVYDH